MMKHQLALGMHPSQECKNAKAKAADKPIENDNTFEQVAREWLETGTLAWTPRYAALESGRFEAGIFPPIGKLDISTTADHGRDTRAILVELGRLKMVGGQEDMIVDVALDMLASS